jgi:hypothetical protein
VTQYPPSERKGGYFFAGPALGFPFVLAHPQLYIAVNEWKFAGNIDKLDPVIAHTDGEN